MPRPKGLAVPQGVLPCPKGHVQTTKKGKERQMYYFPCYNLASSEAAEEVICRNYNQEDIETIRYALDMSDNEPLSAKQMRRYRTIIELSSRSLKFNKTTDTSCKCDEFLNNPEKFCIHMIRHFRIGDDIEHFPFNEYKKEGYEEARKESLRQQEEAEK